MSSKDTKKRDELKIVTPPFRMSFANLFKPKSNFDNQEPKYSCDMLFSKKEDLTALKKAAAIVKRAKWGDKTPKNFRNPFKDGDEKELEDYKGKVFITAQSKMKPGIIDKNKEEILDQSEVYSGMWARATVVPYAYEVKGNAGIGFGLRNIMKIKDDEAFSGRSNPLDDFADVEVDDSDDDAGDDSEAGDDDLDF